MVIYLKDSRMWFHYWALYLCFIFLIAGYLVYEFDKFWFEEKPESIMYFNIYREKFHEKIKRLLLDYNVSLTLKIWLTQSIFYFSHILHTQQNLYVVIEIIWSITKLFQKFYLKKLVDNQCMFTHIYTLSSKGTLSFQRSPL